MGTLQVMRSLKYFDGKCIKHLNISLLYRITNKLQSIKGKKNKRVSEEKKIMSLHSLPSILLSPYQLF